MGGRLLEKCMRRQDGPEQTVHRTREFRDESSVCNKNRKKTTPHSRQGRNEKETSAVSFSYFVPYTGLISEFSRSVNSLLRAILHSPAFREKSSTHARSPPAGAEGSLFRLRSPPRLSSFILMLHHRMPTLPWCSMRRK